MATAEEAIETLNRLSDLLRLRLPDIKKFDDYYRGEHSLRFASEEFKKSFAVQYKGFSDNWCGVVAEAPTERLEPVGIRPRGSEDSKGDLDLWDVWLDSESDAMCDQAFLDAVISKRSFAIVWADSDDQPQITWEHPSQCIVDYVPGSRRRRAAAKIWGDGPIEYATLYMPDFLWKFQRTRVDDSNRTPSGVYVVGATDGWKPREGLPTREPWPLPNPFNEVPVVEFANRPRLLGEPISDIAGTVAMQDALNTQWAYLMNASDYASFPQRVLMGMERPMIPVLDASGQQIGERPVDIEKFSVKRLLYFEDPNSKIGEFSAADLSAYTTVIDVAVSHIAAQTRTPQHYLVGKMANLSADALKAAETGLIKRTAEKTQHFGRAIRDVLRLVEIVRKNEAKAKDIARGEVLWRDIESRSEAQLVDALLKLKTVGFSFRTLAERYGMTPAEVEREVQRREEEMAMDPVAALGRQLEPGAPEEQPKAPDDLAA